MIGLVVGCAANPAVITGEPGATVTAAAIGNPRSGDAQAPPRVNEDALTLEEFNDRLGAYVALHQKLEDELPPLKRGGADARTVDAHQRALADKIRAARSSAKEGDIFAPPVRAWFRRAIARELRQPGGGGARQTITDTESNPSHIMHPVNGIYPDSVPVSTIPPSLLINLPRTPIEVDFRFIGRDLVLRDTHANIIVDVIHDAIQ